MEKGGDDLICESIPNEMALVESRRAVRAESNGERIDKKKAQRSKTLRSRN